MGCCGKKMFTRKQWFTLSAIGSVHFALSICVSLQAPFYPLEAESKNATATEYGFVFGIYELVSFVSSPIFGHYIDVIGAKTLLNVGIVVAAISSIGFGLLDLIESRLYFIIFSFIVRAVEALGSAAAVTSAFAITAAVFPENVATVFATLEIFYGVGYIAGPTIGGALFSLGGFILPFVALGVVLLVDGVFVYLALPPIQKNAPQPKAKIIELTKVPVVFIDSMAIIATSICMGFYSTTLEPHIREIRLPLVLCSIVGSDPGNRSAARSGNPPAIAPVTSTNDTRFDEAVQERYDREEKFDLSAISVGLIFVISGGVYAMNAPIIGLLCDKVANPKIMILIGNILFIMSVLLVGPAPFIPLAKTLGSVTSALVLEGLGMAFILVSSFVDAIKSAVAGGFPDEISTYGLISGLWAASFSLGDFIGPSAGGALKDWVGFPKGSFFIVGAHALVFLVMLIYLFQVRRKSSKVGNMELNLSTIQNNMEKDRNPISIISETDQIKHMSEGYGSVANGKYIQHYS